MIVFQTRMDGPEAETGSVIVDIVREDRDAHGMPITDWQRSFEARSKTGVIHRLARDLAAAGVPDQPWRSTVDGRPRLEGPSIYALAKTKVRENDAGIRLVTWETRPDGISRCDRCDSDRFMHHGCCIRCLPVQDRFGRPSGDAPQRPSRGPGSRDPHPPAPPP